MVSLLPRAGAFLAAARELRILVVHIRTAHLPDGSTLTPSWIRALGAMVGTGEGVAVEGTWGAEFCDGCEPLPGEPVVTKRRSSAFRATELDPLLRGRGIRTVVCIGESTAGCVEATYRDASYHDYYNVLIEDCVAAYDREIHEASLKIQRARHDVCTAEEALAIWRRARAR
jgi:nicotinamidase-related amidase